MPALHGTNFWLVGIIPSGGNLVLDLCLLGTTEAILLPRRRLPASESSTARQTPPVSSLSAM